MNTPRILILTVSDRVPAGVPVKYQGRTIGQTAENSIPRLFGFHDVKCRLDEVPTLLPPGSIAQSCAFEVRADDPFPTRPPDEVIKYCRPSS